MGKIGQPILLKGNDINGPMVDIPGLCYFTLG